MKKNMLEGVATLVSTTIGAGILGLPYVFSKAGFLTGMLILVIIGLSVLFLNLALGEVILRTPGSHQLSGYASIYHGKIGKIIITFAMVFGIYGALTAYLIGERAALSSIFHLDSLILMLIFFVIASTIVLFGIKILEKISILIVGITLTLILAIIITSANFVDISNVSEFNVKNFLIPYGAIFFAFLAIPSIPEMIKLLSDKGKQAGYSKSEEERKKILEKVSESLRGEKHWNWQG